MKAVSPVIPGFEDLEVVYGKDQPEYLDLPGLPISGPEGQVISHYKLSFQERLKVLFHGDIWLSLYTFGSRIQPQLLSTDPPDVKRIVN